MSPELLGSSLITNEKIILCHIYKYLGRTRFLLLAASHFWDHIKFFHCDLTFFWGGGAYSLLAIHTCQFTHVWDYSWTTLYSRNRIVVPEMEGTHSYVPLLFSTPNSLCFIFATENTRMAMMTDVVILLQSQLKSPSMFRTDSLNFTLSFSGWCCEQWPTGF